MQENNKAYRKKSKKLSLFGTEHRSATKTNLTQKNLKKYLIKGDKVLIESSFYLGDMMPDFPEGTQVLVMMEPARLFLKSPPSFLYVGGSAIPENGFIPRMKLEAIALELTKLKKIDPIRIATELLEIRRGNPKTIVYNQPEAWLRDAVSDADLLFQYLLEKIKYKLFGVFLFSDLDEPFLNYVKNNHKAIDQMSGDGSLLFAFEQLGNLERNSTFVKYNVITDYFNKYLKKFDYVLPPREIDKLREACAKFSGSIFDHNTSILLAKKIGIKMEQMPCIAFWQDLNKKEFLVYSFDNNWMSQGHISEHLKSLFDIINEQVKNQKRPKSGYNMLPNLEKKFAALKFKKFVKRIATNETVGTIIKALDLAASL